MVNFPRQARDKHRENAFPKRLPSLSDHYGYPFLLLFPCWCLYAKTIILPRQARDRHSEKLMKILSLSDHYGYYHGYSFLCYRLLYRSLACLRACLWPLPLLRCFPAAGERTRQLSTAPRSHSLSLSSCFVFRSCALCLVERPQNADCSDETGVVMPAPPPPPATTVRSSARVCTAFAIYIKFARNLGSSSLFFAWARALSVVFRARCVCVLCLRTCLLSARGFPALGSHSFRAFVLRVEGAGSGPREKRVCGKRNRLGSRRMPRFKKKKKVVLLQQV